MNEYVYLTCIRPLSPAVATTMPLRSLERGIDAAATAVGVVTVSSDLMESGARDTNPSTDYNTKIKTCI